MGFSKFSIETNVLIERVRGSDRKMFGLRSWHIDQIEEVCVSCLRAKYMVFYHPPGPTSVDEGIEME